MSGVIRASILCVAVCTSFVAGADPGTLISTGQHPFWVTNRDADGDGVLGEWVAAVDLQAGDQVRLADGGEAVLEHSVLLSSEPRALARADDPSFPSQRGTENRQAKTKKALETLRVQRTANGHSNFQLTSAIRSSPSASSDSRTTTSDEQTTTYNFEVADSHTYFVGPEGLWVHNACPRLNVRDAPDLRLSAEAKAIVNAYQLDPQATRRIQVLEHRESSRRLTAVHLRTRRLPYELQTVLLKGDRLAGSSRIEINAGTLTIQSIRVEDSLVKPIKASSIVAAQVELFPKSKLRQLIVDQVVEENTVYDLMILKQPPELTKMGRLARNVAEELGYRLEAGIVFDDPEIEIIFPLRRR